MGEMTGEEKIELVRRLYQMFRERQGDAAFEFIADDVEWDATEVPMPGLAGMYHGHEGVRKFWRMWLDAWEELDWEDVEPQELGDGRVRTHVVQRNKGRDSGIWIDQPLYDQLWTIEDGKVTRMAYRMVR